MTDTVVEPSEIRIEFTWNAESVSPGRSTKGGNFEQLAKDACGPALEHVFADIEDQMEQPPST